MAKYRNEKLNRLIAVTKALSDENRVRVLMALKDREICVCQLVELLGLSPSTVSKHLSILEQAGLLIRRKEGKWHYYRLTDPSRSPISAMAIEWVKQSLNNDSHILSDYKRMDSILKISPEALCCRITGAKR